MMHEEDSARSFNRRPSRFRPTQRVLLLIATGVFLLQAGFIAGLLLERNLARGGPWGDQDLSIVSTLLEVVQEDYYYQPGPATPEAAFEQSLQHGAATGMLETLDGYSQFLPPREARLAAAELSGQYGGIGVFADFVDGALTVTSPMIGSPAEAAGIQPGDVIVAADGRALAEVSEDEALSLLRGEAGTTVVVTIQRAGERAPLEIEVARQAITVPVVTYQLIPGTRVGHIRVTIFGDTTTGQLDAALQRAAADGAAGIILDLRSNGGGWVRSAQESIGRFVPEERGPALYEDNTPGPGGEQPHPIVNSDVAAYDVPLAVLVDGGTASAAEIVAGALQDYERATIVGQTTFGKGSVQRVYEFEDGSSARITFAEWLNPAKQRLQGAGVVPDVVVDPASAPSQTADPWVRAALTLLGASDRTIERSTPSASPVSVHG